MESSALSFATPAKAPTIKSRVAAPARMAWVFQAKTGLDAPFHDLTSNFGPDIIMDLDQIVLDTPIKAAIRATRIFQHYSAQVGRHDETREVMAYLAQGIKSGQAQLDEQALVPPEAVFYGVARPRG